MASTGIVVGTVFTGAVLVLAAACSSSTTSSSSGTSGTGTSSGTSGTPGTSGTGTSGTSASNSLDKCSSSQAGTCTEAEMKPYSDCVLEKCESKYTECYGANWKTGTFAGPCGSYMTCINACACDDVACYGKCAQPTRECSTCLQGATSCASSCTAPACASAGTSSGGGGDGTTKTCAQLQACCNAKADADAKAQCLQTYDGLKDNGDTGCNALYGTMCP